VSGRKSSVKCAIIKSGSDRIKPTSIL